MGEEADRAVEVVPGIGRVHTFQVGDRRRRVLEFQQRDGTPIEWVGCIGARRDDAVVQIPCAGELPFLEDQIGQLFEIADRRILDHHRLEHLDAPAPRVLMGDAAQ